jgi:hypothetical protein
MSFHYHNDEADNKFAAFMSARTRNAAGKMNYSADAVRKAQSLMRLLEQCLYCDRVYDNYPKKHITVKVENFDGVKNKKLYNEVKADCIAQGIEIGTTDAKSMLFHIYNK